MKVKYQIALSIIGILLAITTTVGSSYAFWNVSHTQQSTNSVISGCFEMEYNDIVDGNYTSIELYNAFPVDDEDGKEFSPYVVTLTNNCSVTANYELTLTTDESSTLEDSNLKYYLTNVTTSTNSPVNLLSSLEKIKLDDNMDDYMWITGVTPKDTYLLAKGTLAQNESVTYNLRLWIKGEATNEVMGQYFYAAVGNVSYATNTSTN